MKHLFFGLIALIVFFFSACNGNTAKKEDNSVMEHDMGQMHKDMKDMPMDNGVAAATPSKLQEVFNHYQHVQFALSNDDSKEAANGAKAIGEALTKVDKTSFTAEQQKTYADLEGDMKEHVEHIASNANNIGHQREHFETLSKDFYDAAKSFGAGKTMYKIFCPMYNDNKGAYWLSDSKEVKNPYFGQKMLSCGEVQEELK